MNNIQSSELIDQLFDKASALYENEDYAKAFVIYQKMVELGDFDSLNDIAIMYEFGQGVEKDLEKAIELYQKGWHKTHNTTFALNLANLYLKTSEYNLAIDWWQIAIDNGDDEGKFELAKFLISQKSTNTALIKQFLADSLSSQFVCEADKEEAEILIQQLELK